LMNLWHLFTPTCLARGRRHWRHRLGLPSLGRKAGSRTAKQTMRIGGDSGPARRETKKPSVPKSAGGSQLSSRNSTSSLAVFYVEQVALNRHVSPLQAANPLMTGKPGVVKGRRRQGLPPLTPVPWTFNTAGLNLSLWPVPPDREALLSHLYRLSAIRVAKPGLCWSEEEPHGR
jgi:hypothetical protein